LGFLSFKTTLLRSLSICGASAPRLRAPHQAGHPTYGPMEVSRLPHVHPLSLHCVSKVFRDADGRHNGRSYQTVKSCWPQLGPRARYHKYRRDRRLTLPTTTTHRPPISDRAQFAQWGFVFSQMVPGLVHEDLLYLRGLLRRRPCRPYWGLPAEG
jgi:hypothetical protein